MFHSIVSCYTMKNQMADYQIKVKRNSATYYIWRNDIAISKLHKEITDLFPDETSSIKNHLKKLKKLEGDQTEKRVKLMSKYLKVLSSDPVLKKKKIIKRFFHYLTMPINLKSYEKTKQKFQRFANRKEKLISKWKKIKFPNDRNLITVKMKKLIRKGIPEEYRARVWLLVTNGTERLENYSDGYERCLIKLFGTGTPYPTKFSDYPKFSGIHDYKYHHFNDTTPFERLMHVLENEYLDEIEYCLPISDIVSILFLYFNEREVYAIITEMMDQSKINQKYFPTNKFESNLFEETFIDLILMKKKKIVKKMAKIEVNPLKFVSKWFSRTFVSVLPFQCVLRIFDSYLYEGTKVFYRIGLAILKMCKTKLIKMENEKQFIEILNTFFQGLTEKKIEQMMNIAFKLYLSRAKHFDRLDQKNIEEKSDELLLRQCLFSDVKKNSVSRFSEIDVEGNSKILTKKKFEMIHSQIPDIFQVFNLKLVFASWEHGYNLGTLYRLSLKEGNGPLLLIIRTTKPKWGVILGAFLTQNFSISKNFYGKGNSFVFTFDKQFEVFHWVFNDQEIDNNQNKNQNEKEKKIHKRQKTERMKKKENKNNGKKGKKEHNKQKKIKEMKEHNKKKERKGGNGHDKKKEKKEHNKKKEGKGEKEGKEEKREEGKKKRKKEEKKEKEEKEEKEEKKKEEEEVVEEKGNEKKLKKEKQVSKQNSKIISTRKTIIVEPKQEKHLEKKNKMIGKYLFICSTNDRIQIGGGGSGPSISIGKNLLNGLTAVSGTFNNRPLVSTTDQKNNVNSVNFEIGEIEIWAFRD
ncbi:nucleolar protein 7/estrogen receptor coactivator-related [Anaeramoeba flamelloides]|uniref:Nucleolar protein 7/estrogen receptor coactivator-related n=1 Tax=Anaeramoeba flamelloides TaxID=1746091 RepID=A0ABQ8YXW1_9EUKA|nr:nucleolar protein 7/estrogen receptor coactivator-related [Anaeramoeba flamelloides]